MIDKSESVNWANDWWILGADYLTFEGFMGDFGKKNPADWFREEKSMQRNSWEKTISCTEKILLMTYNAEKKSYTVMWGEKISNSKGVGKKLSPQLIHPYPPSPTNVRLSCQPFRGLGKKRIWHLSKCHPSSRVHHVVVFKTKVLHFKIENTPIKDTNGKKKFKRMLSFLFVGKRHCPLSYSVLKLRSELLIANQIKHVCYRYDW